MMLVPDETVAVAYDLARSMAGPTSHEQMAYDLRRAYWLVDELTKTFEAAGVDPDEIERAEMPYIKPGSRHQSQSSGS